MKARKVKGLSPIPAWHAHELVEEPRRSKLTFAASKECLTRVREPVSRSNSGVQGKMADVASEIQLM
jgi:hypothetical protein